MSTPKTDITVDTSGIRLRLGDVDGSLRTALDDVRGNIRLGLVGVSGNTTHLGTLEEVLLAGADIGMTTQNDAGDETRTVAIDPSGIDILATAGEALSARDMVYLNESDGKWYQQDTDATGTVKMGRIRGCVIASSGIAQDETGLVRVYGEVGGFTSLTPGAKLYASTTAGGYTQTKPFPATGGSQVTVSVMGYAISTTVAWIEPNQLSYRKKDSVSDGGTLSIEHHADTETYERDIDVLVIAPGSTLTSHAEGNADAHHPMQGPTETNDGATAYDNTSETVVAGVPVGLTSGNDQWVSARIPATSGVLTELAVSLGANEGSPVGTITWEIQTDNGVDDKPSSTVLATGEFNPVESSLNTIDVGDGAYIDGSGLYVHLILKSTDAQGGLTNYWRWNRMGGDADPETKRLRSQDGGSSWIDDGSSDIPLCKMTIIDTTDKTSLAQSFQIGSGANIGSVRLYLRKFGTPTGDLTVKIVNDDTGSPDETPSLSATSQVVSASSLTTSFAWYEFEFTTPVTLSASTTYWIILETTDTQSDTDYASWAFEFDTPSYGDGSFQQYEGTWAETTTGDAIFEVLESKYATQTLLDDWGSALATFLSRHDDGAGNNPATQTTIKNNTGSPAVVEMAVTFDRSEA